MTQQDVLNSDRKAAEEESEGKSHSFKASTGTSGTHMWCYQEEHRIGRFQQTELSAQRHDCEHMIALKNLITVIINYGQCGKWWSRDIWSPTVLVVLCDVWDTKISAEMTEIKFIVGKKFPFMGKFGYKFSTSAQKLE